MTDRNGKSLIWRWGGFWILSAPPWIWIALCMVLILILLQFLSGPIDQRDSSLIDTVQAKPIDSKNYAVVKLPHMLGDQGPEWRNGTQFKIQWPEINTNEQIAIKSWALYLPRVGSHFRVIVNGNVLMDVGWNEDVSTPINATSEPYLVQIPNTILKSDWLNNEVFVEVKGRALDSSGLWPVQIGESGQLMRRYKALYTWQVTGTWFMLASCVLIAGAAAIVWVIQRDHLYLVVGLAALFNIVRLKFLVQIYPRLPFDICYLAYNLAFSWYVVTLIVFLDRLAGNPGKTMDRMLISMVLLAPIWHGLEVYTEALYLCRAWTFMLFIMSVKVLWSAITRKGQQKTQEQKSVLVVSAFVLIAVLRDYLVAQHNFPGDANFQWMSFCMLVPMFTWAWVIFERSIRAMNEVRGLKEDVERRVDARSRMLENAYEGQRLSEQHRTAEEVRRKMALHLHDGVGSQLTQALNLVYSSTPSQHTSELVAKSIKEAITEMRFTLDSLEPMGGCLETMLGTIRHRVEPSLKAAGIKLIWRVEEVKELSGFGPTMVLELFRCLQEVFANIIKHSQASLVTVSTWQQGQEIWVTVEDNGIGLNASKEANGGEFGSGHCGLRNLKNRATNINAKLQVVSTDSGTCVSFTFQVEPLALFGGSRLPSTPNHRIKLACNKLRPLHCNRAGDPAIH